MSTRGRRFGWVLALVFAVGCSSGTSDPGGGQDAVEDLGADAVAPPDDAPGADASQEFPPALAAHLLKAMDEYLAFSADPGVSVALRLADGTTFVEARGSVDLLTGAPMTPDSAFRVGSNTKPYITALVMHLVDEGLVTLDDPLSTYVTDYPAWDAITIRQLLGMQSGIPDYMLTEAFMMVAVFSPEALTTPDYLLSFVKDLPLDFEPGTESLYTNTNYILVGLIIEEVTGLPAHEALQTLILDPLGLDATYLDVVDEPKAELSHGYLDLAIVGFLFGLTAEAVNMIPKTWFMEDYLVDATYLFPPMFAWTDGGLITTPGDAMEFMHALLTGAVVSAASLAEMQKTTLTPILGTPVDYGLGLSTSTGPFGTRWGHGGLNFGYEANTIYFPERDVTLSHMHNYLPEQSYRLEDEMLAILDDEPTEPPGPACAAPEASFWTEDGDVVTLRFKGTIGPEDEGGPQGIGLVRGVLDGEKVALYGYDTTASEHVFEDVRRVDINSSAPSMTAGVDRRTVTISVDASVLDGADGAVSPSEPLDVVVLVTEQVLDPESGNIEKTCVVAVQDAARPPRLTVCGGPDHAAEVGDVLRLFGVVPLTRDVDAIDAIVGLVPMPRCSCADGQGDMVPCPGS
jgi:D-alanyl-D-alanine carboxypeptidase